MIPFPFNGASDPGSDSITLSANRSVNLYPEADQRYKDQFVLLGFPGHQELFDTTSGPMRGSKQFNDELIYVSGQTVWSMSTGFYSRKIGVLGTKSGVVVMAENGVQLVIVDGEDGWVYTKGLSNITLITDAVFVATKTKTISALDGMFIAVKEGTREFFVSTAYDPQTWPGLKTASAEFQGGVVNATWADRELFIFTPNFTQVYYNSSASPMPWLPIRTGRLLYGLAAPNSLAICDNTTYFLARGPNGALFIGRLNGYNIERVSTRAWEREWGSYETVEDAIGIGIQWDGHEWYVLTFPSALHGHGKTFLFDSEAGTLGLFEIGDYQAHAGDFGSHQMRIHSYFNGKHLIGDNLGKWHEMKADVFTYDTSPLISLRRAPVLHANRERMFFNSLQIDCEVGSGGTTMLDISDDGGRTFDNRRYKTMGTAGQYDERVIYRQLGSAFDRVFQFSVSDAVNRKFLSAYLN